MSFSFFYDNLSPYGEWVNVGNYGTAWHPTQVDNEWSPYTEGSWAYTEDGWTWVSDEPWADMVYHYGRWVDVDGYGWCWVPGYEWGPAWVSWRSSDDYVGWAPLPPEAVWQPTVGFSIWTDSYYDIGPRYYRFCRVRDFSEPNLRHVVLPWRQNTALISLTYNITNINYNDDSRRVFSGGPNLAYLRERTSRPVRYLRLVDESSYRRSSVRGEDYRVFRPSIDRDNDRDRDRVRSSIARSFDQGKIDRGWRDSGDENQRRDLRNRLQDQVRGLNPKNAPATMVAKTSGGLTARELKAKHERRSDDKDKGKGPFVDPRSPDVRNDNLGKRDRDDKDRGPIGDPRRPDGRGDDRDGKGKGNDGNPRGPMVDPRGPDGRGDDRDGKGKGKGNDDKPKGPMVDPRRPDSKGDGREDIRRGLPMPPDRDPGKKGDDDKTKGPMADPRKAPGGADNDRRGIPVPPSVKRPTGRNDNDRDGGSTRPPVVPGGMAPDTKGQPKKDIPDRPTLPKKSEGIQRPEGRSPGPFKMSEERPATPRNVEPPQVKRPAAPDRPAPKVQERPTLPKKMEAPSRQDPPKVQQRPPMPQRTEAPKVERRAPGPAPKPQEAPGRGPDSDKKKDSKKKDKDDR